MTSFNVNRKVRRTCLSTAGKGSCLQSVEAEAESAGPVIISTI